MSTAGAVGFVKTGLYWHKLFVGYLTHVNICVCQQSPVDTRAGANGVRKSR